MAETSSHIRLSNGVEMPALALGTAPLSSTKKEVSENPSFVGFLPERVYRSVQLALDSGLRHIDTALMYRSHRQISQVLGNFFALGKLERKDVFLTSKVFHPPTNGFSTSDVEMPANLNSMTPDQVSKHVMHQFEQTLVELGIGYVDLMLLHWPGQEDTSNPTGVDGNAGRRYAAWSVLESMYEKGWARAIGVSNFSEYHLEQLRKDGARIVPMVNQIEASIFLQYNNILKYCQDHNIVPEAYSPLGRGVKSVTTDPVVLSIAEKHGKNSGQIALKYLLQLGYAVTFLSQSEKHITSNQQVFDFELDRSDLEKLSSLNVPNGTWGLSSPYDIS